MKKTKRKKNHHQKDARHLKIISGWLSKRHKKNIEKIERKIWNKKYKKSERPAIVWEILVYTITFGM